MFLLSQKIKWEENFGESSKKNYTLRKKFHGKYFFYCELEIFKHLKKIFLNFHTKIGYSHDQCCEIFYDDRRMFAILSHRGKINSQFFLLFEKKTRTHFLYNNFLHCIFLSFTIIFEWAVTKILKEKCEW